MPRCPPPRLELLLGVVAARLPRERLGAALLTRDPLRGVKPPERLELDTPEEGRAVLLCRDVVVERPRRELRPKGRKPPAELEERVAVLDRDGVAPRTVTGDDEELVRLRPADRVPCVAPGVADRTPPRAEPAADWRTPRVGVETLEPPRTVPVREGAEALRTPPLRAVPFRLDSEKLRTERERRCC